VWGCFVAAVVDDVVAALAAVFFFFFLEMNDYCAGQKNPFSCVFRNI
jgi:hypothetical protein